MKQSCAQRETDMSIEQTAAVTGGLVMDADPGGTHALASAPVLVSEAELSVIRESSGLPVDWELVGKEVDLNKDTCVSTGGDAACNYDRDWPGKPNSVSLRQPTLLTCGESQSFSYRFGLCRTPKEALAVATELKLTPAMASQQLYRALFRDPPPSPTLLGMCLGSHLAFWQNCARSFPLCFDNHFQGVPLADAIRMYLFRFRLPGESAQIERILEGFAGAYFKQNQPTHRDGSLSQSGPGATGFYIRQPRHGRTVCCIHCGSTSDLATCRGCECIYFCRPCRKLASKRGHAAVGHIGHGVACIKARALAGLPPRQDHCCDAEDIDDRPASWEACSPFLNKDSVMVLAYSIIMLTTNLHSVKVKDKMTLFQFIRQNRGINDGHNFPGDFLESVYEAISTSELKVVANDRT